MSAQKLRDVFVAARAQDRSSWDSIQSLGTRLAQLTQEGAKAWPDIALPADAFVAFLANCLPPRGDPLPQLVALPAADLYLACACSRGERGAALAFESVLAAVVPALRRIVKSDDDVDEMLQVVRDHVLVVEPGRPARIGSYNGSGTLVSWLRITGSRIALRRAKRETRETPLGHADDLASALPQRDAELRHIKREYRAHLKAALAAAITNLASRDRTVLRYSYLDELTLDEIAGLYHVDASTISRWLAKARDGVLRSTRRTLSTELGLDRAEFEDMMELIASRLDMSVSRLLRDD